MIPTLQSEKLINIPSLTVEYKDSAGVTQSYTMSYVEPATIETLVDVFNSTATADGVPVQWQKEKDLLYFECSTGNMVSAVFTYAETKDYYAVGYTYRLTDKGKYSTTYDILLATYWGVRLPFEYLLEGENKLNGGVTEKQLISVSLSNKDVTTPLATTSSKYTRRKGYNLIYRLHENDIDGLDIFIELCRNTQLKFYNGSDYNFDASKRYNLLTSESGDITYIYYWFGVCESNLQVLEEKNEVL